MRYILHWDIVSESDYSHYLSHFRFPNIWRNLGFDGQFMGPILRNKKESQHKPGIFGHLSVYSGHCGSSIYRGGNFRKKKPAQASHSTVTIRSPYRTTTAAGLGPRGAFSFWHWPKICKRVFVDSLSRACCEGQGFCCLWSSVFGAI